MHQLPVHPIFLLRPGRTLPLAESRILWRDEAIAATDAFSDSEVMMGNSIPHGIMFHHFHGGGHPPSQGSITAEQMAQIIEHYGRDKIMSAPDWAEGAAAGTLSEGTLCITFDDALRCQFDIALPVLESYRIKAFWFVYTSVVRGGIELLEVHRKFRTVHFDTTESFYDAFFDAVANSAYAAIVTAALAEYPPDFLAEFDFYTDADKRFRYVRNIALGEQRYNNVMAALMADVGIDIPSFASDLWMREDHLRTLHDSGHVVGLHSHTHPVSLASLEENEQAAEYQHNSDAVRQITGVRPYAMSHPCNSYTATTLEVLRDLGVTLGFRANMAKPALSELEHPRQDHINILKALPA